MSSENIPACPDPNYEYQEELQKDYKDNDMVQIRIWPREKENGLKRIGLVNMEPKYMNLAIEKLRMHHEGLEHEVIDTQVPTEPMLLQFWLESFDQVYVSSIFTFTPKEHVPINDPRVTVGGTGFDVLSKLPDEIERLKPKLNFGFTSRGCIRKCDFCAVPEKEGHIHAVGDLYDLWDGKANQVTLLDNNILALGDHFEMICKQAIKENVKLDFNQGLDIRLLTKDHVKLLSQIKIDKPRFAFDHPQMADMIADRIGWLKDAGIKVSSFYVLVGFDTTIEEDLFRLRLLRKAKQNAYVMKYRPVTPEQALHHRQRTYDELKILNGLSNWANQHWLFHKMDFAEYLQEQRGHYYVKYLDRLGVKYAS